MEHGNDVIVTEITGTFRVDFKVGEVIKRAPIKTYGVTDYVSIKVLRETTEQEYREKYNYHGPLPIDPLGREPRFFEIVALD